MSPSNIQTHSAHSSEFFGIILKVLSGIGFSMMAGVIKYLGGSIPLGQVVFFRSIVALIPLVLFLMWTREFPSGLYTKHPWKHVVRCVLGTLAMFCAFAALRFLPLAEATALAYLSPVVLVFFAIVLLKEAVSIRRWLGVGFGVMGLAVMTLPSLSAHADTRTLIGIGLGVASAVLIAGAMLQVRQLSTMGESAGAIAFYFALTSTVIGMIALLDGWVNPEPWQWWCLVSIGLLGGVAQIFMTLAFKYAEASALAPYEYLSIVWAVILGMAFFAEIPDVVFWVAMPLILVGAIIAKPRKSKTI